jgi:hypothetical protein
MTVNDFLNKKIELDAGIVLLLMVLLADEVATFSSAPEHRKWAMLMESTRVNLMNSIFKREEVTNE